MINIYANSIHSVELNLLDGQKYGIPIMNFFHPDGYKYSNKMNGFSNIFLVNESAENLLSRKRTIDNSCEACCNFQCNFLESQLMTRFMYPNPKLIF